MTEKKFVNYAKLMIQQYLKDVEKIELPLADIYTVWLVKVLENNKGMFSTTLADTRYYEITYNGTKEEFYFDSYVKEKNVAIPLKEVEL